MSDLHELSFSLKGRRALITGASSGIGKAVASALAAQGAEIVLHHCDDEIGARTAADAMGGAAIVEADFADTNSTDKFVRQLAADHGPIDILIANAAIEHRCEWKVIDESHVQSHVATNYLSLLTLIRELVPGMADKGWGRVVATGSVMARRPRAETVIYASLKAAQLVAVRAIAREVAHRGVTMNVISPGAIETEANAERYRDREFRQAVSAKIPAGRHGQTRDLIGAFVLLCSDAANYITGADIPVDGGWTIGDAPGTLPTPAAMSANTEYPELPQQ